MDNFVDEGTYLIIFFWPLGRRMFFHYNICLGKWKNYVLPSRWPNGGKKYWARVMRSGPN